MIFPGRNDPLGEIMNRKAMAFTGAGMVLAIAGCASGPGAEFGSGTAPVASPPASAASSSGPRPSPSGQAHDRPVGVSVIPLGKNNGVEARLPINAYFAAPGMEIRFDASDSVGGVDSYEWDYDGDGTYDATTSDPVFRHTYTDEFDGEMILRVSNIVGSTHILRTPVHVSARPYFHPLAPPANVQVRVLSTINGISEIRVSWESNDPSADSWAIAINGMPVGRIEKSARSTTVTDVERKEDVLVQVFGITAGMEVGDRAGTTLPAVR